MNHWIPPSVNEEIEIMLQHQADKRFERDEAFFLENIPFPNYVLIDAVVWELYMDEILYKLEAEVSSLFAIRGADHDLDTVAPYILSYTPELASWMNAGEKRKLRKLLLYSEHTIESLRSHLRHFLRVKTEQGKYLYFRLYDPYVVNVVFPCLNEKQLKELFASVKYFMTQDIRIDEQRIFYLRHNGKLNVQYKAIDYVDNK